jgi:hypothetical protein
VNFAPKARNARNAKGFARRKWTGVRSLRRTFGPDEGEHAQGDVPMNIELSRRQLLHGVGASVAGTTLGALGFGGVETAYASSIRAWKLAGTTETRNTCTYCAVGCGIIMYSKGNFAKGEKAEITHIEGDPDHPTNRGGFIVGRKELIAKINRNPVKRALRADKVRLAA